MLAQVRLERLVELEACDRETVAAGKAREQLGTRAAWKVDAGALRWTRVGQQIGRSQLNEPGPIAERSREPHLHPASVEPRLERGRKRCRRVHHQEVTGGEEVRQLAESGVDELEIVSSGDEHRHVVAAEPTRLRRLVRLQVLRELECAHAAVTCTSSRAR